ncbi:hypothetical protein RMATCC62417_07034 [Rhizopus microsporus]|nr:hypothetical protein RMATCC62417_07034 [Rhizopus microsporus]CEI88180.1 hypothetical protein RMCBS344292_02578 [Rhizopus microsporus]
MKKTKKKQDDNNSAYFPPSPPPIHRKLSLESDVGRPPPVIIDHEVLQDLAAFISARESSIEQTRTPPSTPPVPPPHVFVDTTCQMDFDLVDFLNDDELCYSDSEFFPALPKR